MKAPFILATAALLCGAQSADLVMMEMMTYPEINAAIHSQGKTTVLIFNGGTEQRGPHAVLGGHTLIARRAAEAIARRLGNALVAPVFPFSPAGGHLNAKWPGTVTVSDAVFAGVNEALVASMAVNGFRNIVLLGDHGGGQQVLRDLAERLDRKYGPQGVHVYFCGEVYDKARRDFNALLKEKGLPVGTHASVPDTSEMLYLGGDQWVRRDKIAAGNGSNGVSGDPRPSSPELGKQFFDLRVKYGVESIRRMIANR